MTGEAMAHDNRGDEQESSGHAIRHSAGRVGRSTGTRAGIGQRTILGVGAGVAMACVVLVGLLLVGCLVLIFFVTGGIGT
jgi:tetrahydromethanopterin S-methyltransferase subunit F